MKTMFSGIQPTGIPHIGNYFGAIQRWATLSQSTSHQFLFSLMDLHAITVPRKAQGLTQDTFDGACAVLACGIKPSQNCSLFVQSHVKQHLELYWVLQSISKLGGLKRMTQFKEKTSKSSQEDVYVGLLAYPVLMAADILLYRAFEVPVGEDQLQHIEFTRDVALAFHRMFEPNVFPLPVASPLNKNTMRIMSLTDPLKKMSKSEIKLSSRILLSDDPDVISRKVKSATTDSLGAVSSRLEELEERRGVFNLVQLLAICLDSDVKTVLEKECQGKDMSTLKSVVADALIHRVEPIRLEIIRLQHDKPFVLDVLRQGRLVAEKQAEDTMVAVRKAVGFLPVVL